MNTGEAFTKARQGSRIRRSSWPADKFLVYDFEPGQGWTIRDAVGWLTDAELATAPIKDDWEIVK